MSLTRRSALAPLPAALLAAQRHFAQLQSAGGPQTLRFFTLDEHSLVDRLTEMILPADDHSPGAREAQVAAYIDLVLSYSPPARRKAFREALAGLAGASMAKLAAAEKKPETPAEHLFVELKKLTLLGYYTSEIGLRRELGYQGNAALASFPGCTHPSGTHR